MATSAEPRKTDATIQRSLRRRAWFPAWALIAAIVVAVPQAWAARRVSSPDWRDQVICFAKPR